MVEICNTIAFTIMGILLLIVACGFIISIVKFIGKLLNNVFFLLFADMALFIIFINSPAIFVFIALLYIILPVGILGRYTIIKTNQKCIPKQMWDEDEYTERLCQEHDLPNPTIAKYEQEQQQVFNEIEQQYIESLREDKEDESLSWNESVSQIKTQYELTADSKVNY